MPAKPLPWRGPGRAHSGGLEFLRTVLPLIATFGAALPRGLKVQGSIDAHPAQGRFWYLHYVGVRPDHQGKGTAGGSSRRRRRWPMPMAFLAGWRRRRPGNVPLYERLGFVTATEWDVADGGPHFWGMMRPA